jgi:outer membrane protein assembly factor BamB
VDRITSRSWWDELFPGTELRHIAWGTTCAVLLLGSGSGCHAVERLIVGPRVDNEHPTPLRLIWHTRTEATPDKYWFGQPALDNGKLFVEDANRVAAFDAVTGRALWARPVRIGPVPVAQAVLARGGRVYIAEVDSILAMDAADGHTLWNVRPDSQAAGAFPAVDDDALYAGQRGIPTVYAIAVADGRLLWKTTVGQGWTFPAHVMGITGSGDTVYVNVWRFLTLNGYLSQGVLVALDRRNGSEIWRYESPDTASGFHFPPAVSGRFIVVSDPQGGRTLGLDRFTKQLLWTVPHHTNSTPVIVGDTVFGASNDLYAWAARLSTGALLWQKKTGGSFFASTYCAGGVIANQGMVQRLDAADGAYTGAFNVQLDVEGTYTSAFVADGSSVYFTGQGGVYAVACRP